MPHLHFEQRLERYSNHINAVPCLKQWINPLAGTIWAGNWKGVTYPPTEGPYGQTYPYNGTWKIRIDNVADTKGISGKLEWKGTPIYDDKGR